MSELKEIAAEAAELLPSAFVWVDTPQGHKYWAQVHADLRQLAGLEVDNSYSGDYFHELGTAPLSHEEDRKDALELAELMWSIQVQVESEGLRWLVVHDELRALGDEGPTDAEWEAAIGFDQ